MGFYHEIWGFRLHFSRKPFSVMDSLDMFQVSHGFPPVSHMDVGQNGRPMWDHRCECLVLVLTIQLLGYLILTHTHDFSLDLR